VKDQQPPVSIGGSGKFPQLPRRVLVSGRGTLAKLIRLIVFGQQVSLPPPRRVFCVLAQRADHRNDLTE